MTAPATDRGLSEADRALIENPPFFAGGAGHLMTEAGNAYLKDYVMTTEGDDHTPTDFERWLLEDFFAGLMSEESFFGPVRRLALLAAARREGEGAALQWLADNPSCELGFGHNDEPDDCDRCWLVHRVRGGVNDREWTLIASGETPLEALSRAAALDRGAGQ